MTLIGAFVLVPKEARTRRRAVIAMEEWLAARRPSCGASRKYLEIDFSAERRRIIRARRSPSRNPIRPEKRSYPDRKADSSGTS